MFNDFIVTANFVFVQLLHYFWLVLSFIIIQELIQNKINTKPMDQNYFLALLARLENSSLQMVEYFEFISLGIKTG